MYIDPFVCGVLATLFAESAAFVLTCVVMSRKRKGKGGQQK